MRGGFREDLGNLRGWLFTILNNHLRDLHRRQRPTLALDAARDAATDAAEPSVEDAETRAAIERELATLPDQFRLAAPSPGRKARATARSPRSSACPSAPS